MEKIGRDLVPREVAKIVGDLVHLGSPEMADIAGIIARPWRMRTLSVMAGDIGDVGENNDVGDDNNGGQFRFFFQLRRRCLRRTMAQTTGPSSGGAGCNHHEQPESVR